MQAEPLSVLSLLPKKYDRSPTYIVKRDGESKQSFDENKIYRAVRGAWFECFPEQEDNVQAKNNIWAVVQGVTQTFVGQEEVTVEQIQDAVELVLMRAQRFEVAKAFILFRQRRAEERRTSQAVDPQAIADYIHPAKYARYLPTKRRREVYNETVARVEEMHLKRFADKGISDDIRWAFDFVRAKRVLPSMRSMQFGGIAIEKNHARQYNCSYTLIDRPRVFGEVLYLLLCGCGVGYSVQYEHVEKLPTMASVDRNEVYHHTIDDSIEGWADALNELIQAHINGYYVEFNYAQIRPVGSPLRTSGGKAPGHLGLRDALEAIREILNGAAGRQLRPIEAHDVLCHAADAVLSGGVRRSAMISLFSPEDGEMMNQKTGALKKSAHWRENANNSVVFLRNEVTERQFKRLFSATKQFGEPGFAFVNNRDYGVNPCAEIALDPVLFVTEKNVEYLRDKGYSVRAGDKLTGFAFCNLTTINAAKLKSFEDFEATAKAATIIGTLQAAYTDFPYLGAASEEIAKRDALLGVSMTGMLDSPKIACNPDFQRSIAASIVRWNKELAEKIGVNQAARTTCVKPEGTSSLALGGVASGAHAHHARRYIRRVTANEAEPVFQYFRKINPHMCVRKPNGDWIIEFVIQAPEDAILKDDIGAIEFLEMVRSSQQNWVVPGTGRESNPPLNHNVSNTVQVRDHEWDAVRDYLWENRADFTAVSLLPAVGDKIYPFAPNEAITTEADEIRWRQIIANYTPVDYLAMIEEDDVTDLAGEVACAGGACAL
jgi:ribonucleoside-triphosphate reductase